METRKHIAAEKKRCNSHNCAQAILHTYADIAGISEDEAMSIAGAFGGGMGNMEGTCGALVGAGLVLGLVNKDKVKSSQQRQSKVHETDAPDNDQVPREKRSHTMQTTERCRYKGSIA